MEILKQKKEVINPLSDKDLLIAIQKSGKDENIMLLQSELFARFRGYVLKGATQRTRQFPDTEDFAIDITQQTFISFFGYIHKIKFPTTASESECTRIIKGLLGEIANNHFNKEFARRQKFDTESLDLFNEILPDVTFDLFESLYTIEPVEVPNGFKMKLQAALNSIKKERDKHIILEYAREGCLDNKQHLSANTVAYLCGLYKTTPENLRQIKKRTLDKIKQFCFAQTDT